MEAFLLYVDDWLGSTNIEAMDAHEERGYLRLLLHAAKQEDCGLPNDPALLSRLSKLGPRWKRGSGEVVLRCFFERDGRLYNKRLCEVHRDFLLRRERRQKAAHDRWEKPKEAPPNPPEINKPTDAMHMQTPCNADAMHMQTPCTDPCKRDAETMLPIPTPTPNVKPENLKPFSSGKPDKELLDKEHERFYRAYWCHANKQASRRAFEKRVRSLVKQGQEESISTAAEFLIERVAVDRARWEAKTDWEWRVKLHPATWLNGMRWDDEPSASTAVVPIQKAQPIDRDALKAQRTSALFDALMTEQMQ